MRLNLNDIRYIINESYRKLLLTEISNNAIETLFKKYIPQLTGIMNSTLQGLANDSSQSGEIFNALTVITPEDVKKYPDMKLKDCLRLKIMEAFDINRGRGPIKYLRGIIRICCDKNEKIMMFFNLNEEKLKNFKNLIGYIYTNNLELNEDLNGLSYDELYTTIGSKMRIDAYKKWSNGEDENQKKNVFGEYTVIPINGYEDASKYSQYTSWCVTQGAHHYNSYTNDGSQFFFCLKNGFEGVKRIKGEGCPLDEYGLSMVSVLIRPNGDIKHITTRWNHDNNGEDNYSLNTLEQVENVLGIPRSVFSNKIPPEMEVDDIQRLIDEGIDINRLIKYYRQCGDIMVITYKSKFNAMKDKVLLMGEWYNDVHFLDGNLISFKKYDANRGTVFNFCDERGQMFPKNMGFGTISVYDKKRDVFKISGTYGANLIKRGSDSVLLPHNVSNMSPMKDGYAIIETNGKNTNIMTEDFKMLWDEPIRYRSSYIVNRRARYYKEMGEGMLIVMNDNWKENYIDIHTKELISEEWFDDCQTFHDGFGRITDNRKVNLIRRDGTLLSSTWCDDMNITPHKYVSMDTGDSKITILDTEGNPVKQFECDNIFDYNGKYCIGKDGIDVVVFNNDGSELYRVEAIVGLIFSDIFLILKPECILVSDKGNVISNNVALMNDVDGEPLNGKIVLHDYVNEAYLVITTERDKYIVLKDTEKELLKKYLRTNE